MIQVHTLTGKDFLWVYMSAKLALDRYSRRQMRKKPREKKQKNESPEKEVEKEVIEFLEKSGFDISIVESKAVFSQSAGRYLRGQTEAGFSDIAGVCPDGIGCFIELKAKGKKRTIRPAQVDFLTRKIRKNAFGCCVDSVSDIADIYNNWLNLRATSINDAQKYLLDILPKSSLQDRVDAAIDDLPW